MGRILLLAIAPALIAPVLAACNPQTSNTDAAAVAPAASGSDVAAEIAAPAEVAAVLAPAPSPSATAILPADAAPPAPVTNEQKTIYALGVISGRQIAVFNLTPDELKLYDAGVRAGALATQPVVDVETYKSGISPLARTRMRAASVAYLDRAALEAGAVKTASGLIYKSLQDGSGASPKPDDIVKVQYRGTTIAGDEVDSSYGRGGPVGLPLGETIRCWNEGVQMMKVGGKAKLVCPAQLAYGDRGSPPRIPGDATLIFEIELVGIGD